VSGGEEDYTPIVLDRDALLKYLGDISKLLSGGVVLDYEEWIEAHDVTWDWL